MHILQLLAELCQISNCTLYVNAGRLNDPVEMLKQRGMVLLSKLAVVSRDADSQHVIAVMMSVKLDC